MNVPTDDAKARATTATTATITATMLRHNNNRNSPKTHEATSEWFVAIRCRHSRRRLTLAWWLGWLLGWIARFTRIGCLLEFRRRELDAAKWQAAPPNAAIATTSSNSRHRCGYQEGERGKAVGLRQQLYGCVPFCCLIRLPSAAVVADVVVVVADVVVVVAAVDDVSSLWFLKPFTSIDL